MRSRIAAQAARLMADHGIDDFSLAKHKAARQLGAPATQSLPDNDEIETELRIYRSLYQSDDHPAVILELRRKALAAMRFFEKFEPYLAGPVLKGTAGRHSVVNVLLFAADEKEIEFFLLDRQIRFNVSGEGRVGRTSGAEVSAFDLEWDGTPLHLELHDAASRRWAKSARPDDSPPMRAGISALAQLIAEDSSTGTGG
jgi:hypothetical protein